MRSWSSIGTFRFPEPYIILIAFQLVWALFVMNPLNCDLDIPCWPIITFKCFQKMSCTWMSSNCMSQIAIVITWQFDALYTWHATIVYPFRRRITLLTHFRFLRIFSTSIRSSSNQTNRMCILFPCREDLMKLMTIQNLPSTYFLDNFLSYTIP